MTRSLTLVALLIMFAVTFAACGSDEQVKVKKPARPAKPAAEMTAAEKAAEKAAAEAARLKAAAKRDAQRGRRYLAEHYGVDSVTTTGRYSFTVGLPWAYNEDNEVTSTAKFPRPEVAETLCASRDMLATQITSYEQVAPASYNGAGARTAMIAVICSLPATKAEKALVADIRAAGKHRRLLAALDR